MTMAKESYFMFVIIKLLELFCGMFSIESTLPERLSAKERNIQISMKLQNSLIFMSNIENFKKKKTRKICK